MERIVESHPWKTDRTWGMYSSAQGIIPAECLALNFDAPGDRKDASGNLWLAFPRPGKTRLVLNFELENRIQAGGGYTKGNSEMVEVANTRAPWLYAQGCRGLRRCVVPLVGEADGPAKYSVRLVLASLDGDKPGQRVFDVKLQGKRVAQALDPAQLAGASGKAVDKVFSGIEVEDNVVLELIPAAQKPSPAQLPVLYAL